MIVQILRFFYLLCAVLLMAGCSKDEVAPEPTPVPVPDKHDTKPWPFDAYIDSSIRPGDDFYNYIVPKYVQQIGFGVFDEQDQLGIKFVEEQLVASDNPTIVTLREIFDKAENVDYLDEVERCNQLIEQYKARVSGFTTIEEVLEEYVYLMSIGAKTYFDNVVAVYNRKLCFLLDGRPYNSVNGSWLAKINDPNYEFPAQAGTRASNYRVDYLLEQIKKEFGEGAVSDETLLYTDQMKYVINFYDTQVDNQKEKLIKYYSDYVSSCQYLNFEKVVDNPAVAAILCADYLKQHIHQSEKEYFAQLAGNFTEAFEQRLDSLDWMSPTTKKYAKQKLSNMYMWDGTPARPAEDFIDTKVELNASMTKFEALAALHQHYYRNIVKPYLGKEINHDVLYISSMLTQAYPWIANAFYLYSNNAMIIVASNLVHPSVRMDVSEAYNYGVMGTTLGHELCHAFDSDGAKYNAQGKRENWWTTSDGLIYVQKQRDFVNLFNNFYLGNYPVDGSLTLAENMADMGGFATALQALKNHCSKQGYGEEETKEQIRRFFLSWGLGWGVANPPARPISNDPHAPVQIRVNGIMCNFQEWYDLFDVQWGDKFYLLPEQRLSLW